MTPLELVTGKQCTPGCLAATTGVSRCACPCRGRFHALVTGSDVTVLIAARESGRDRLTDDQLIEGAARTA